MFHIFSFSKKLNLQNEQELKLEYKITEKILELESKKGICKKYHANFDLSKIEFALDILYEILQK